MVLLIMWGRIVDNIVNNISLSNTLFSWSFFCVGDWSVCWAKMLYFQNFPISGIAKNVSFYGYILPHFMDKHYQAALAAELKYWTFAFSQYWDAKQCLILCINIASVTTAENPQTIALLKQTSDM